MTCAAICVEFVSPNLTRQPARNRGFDGVVSDLMRMAKYRMRAAARNFVDSEVASPAVPVRHVAVAAARVAAAAGCAIWEWMALRTWRVASHAGLS